MKKALILAALALAGVVAYVTADENDSYLGRQEVGGAFVDILLQDPDADRFPMWDDSADGWVWNAGGGGGVSDHGALTGLTDDDHPQYLLIDGSRTMTGGLAVDHASGYAANFRRNTASGSGGGAGVIIMSDDGAALVNGDRFGYLILGGSDTASTDGLSVGLAGFASENWTGTANGGDLHFFTSDNGTSIRDDRLIIRNDGDVEILAGVLEVTHDQTSTAIFTSTLATSAAGGSGIIARTTDGAAMSSGHRLGFFLFDGDDGGGTGNNAAGLTSYAEQTWTGSAHGASIRFATTANNSTARTERVELDNSGDFFPLASGQYDLGIQNQEWEDIWVPRVITDGSMIFRVDADNDGITNFTWQNGTGSTIATLDEGGALDLAGNLNMQDDIFLGGNNIDLEGGLLYDGEVSSNVGVNIYTETLSATHTLTDAGGQLKGGVYYIDTTGVEADLPAVSSGDSITVHVIGAITGHIDPNTNDQIYLDGTLLDDGDRITSTGASGDVAVLTYIAGSDGDGGRWYASTNGWTDGG